MLAIAHPHLSQRVRAQEEDRQRTRSLDGPADRDLSGIPIGTYLQIERGLQLAGRVQSSVPHLGTLVNQKSTL